MQIDRLDWDSDFFGYEVGKIEWSDEIKTADFLNSAPKSEYKLIYIFSDVALPSLNLVIKDRKLTLHQNLDTIDSLGNNQISLHSYSYDPESFEQLRALVLQSGVYSRFNTDRQFKNNEYERLYSEWIKQSVLNEKAFECIVYLEQNNIMAFTTLNKKDKNLADIGLVAVHPDSRGKGVGSSIVLKSLERAKDFGFSEIQVVTQQANVPALSLYKKCGFKIQQAKYIYHYWNYDTV